MEHVGLQWREGGLGFAVTRGGAPMFYPLDDLG